MFILSKSNSLKSTILEVADIAAGHGKLNRFPEKEAS